MTIKLIVGIAIRLPRIPDKLSLLNVAIEIGIVAIEATKVVIDDEMK
jgi:hypothetical protein